MGFATEEQVETFLMWTPAVERAMIASGIILVKYWLEETKEDEYGLNHDRRCSWARVASRSPRPNTS
jgi:polyphosphate kinase 2 (PPK2 family)